MKSFLKNVDAGKEETGEAPLLNPSYDSYDIIKRNKTNLSVLVSTGCETDYQIDGITKMAPVVAFYAGKPDMLEKVEQAVRVTQNNDACVAETLAAARSARLPSVSAA